MAQEVGQQGNTILPYLRAPASFKRLLGDMGHASGKRDPCDALANYSFLPESFDGDYEPVFGFTPLNLPRITCVLIKENECVDVVCGVEGKASDSSPRNKGFRIDDIGEAVILVAPLHLPKLPLARV